VLPLIGVVLGTAMGAEPASVLLSTDIGQACLVVGGLCALGGISWMDHIARGAEVYS
jgi:tight adherence protein B